MQGEKVALITGSSSGIGFETSVLLAKNGFHTYASMRNPEKSRVITEIANREKLPIQVIQLDVTDDASVKEAISKIVSEEERIDVLVNNAGYDLFSPIEDLTLNQVKEQFETNFFGVVRLTKEVLPVMRRQKKGNIVTVSSVGGRVGTPLNSAYTASKFAVEGFSESMRYELNEFGFNVIIIEPGVIRTNFIENIKTADLRSGVKSPYADLIEKTMNGFGALMENSSAPKIVAETILNAITSKEPEIRYLVGDDAQSIMKVRKSTSDKEFENWMNESILQKKGFLRKVVTSNNVRDKTK